MDTKSQTTLELPKILTQLAEHADFSASKELARGLTPSAKVAEAERRLAATGEARRELEENPQLSIGGARDVRPQAADAARGLVLEPSDFLRIKDTLIAARSKQRHFADREQDLPELCALAAGLTLPEGLIDRISQVLDDRGEVLDSASSELKRIRSQHKVAYDRLMDKLQSMVNDSKYAPLLQDPIVTQREGRYVIPLRAEHKGKIKAVVHDQSSSGATLFVEPLQAVDLNNEVRQLELAEREEIRRLLAELSERVGHERELIDSVVNALAQLDLAFAKARYAQVLDASAPTLKPIPSQQKDGRVHTRLRLLGARHPLLDPEQVVPVDLVLEDEVRALVITGPNTGGKTVTLKTAGLLVLMAQCGLHIPAEGGSELSVFRQVFADIGDEQSIEQSLSTFSAHVSNIIRILEQADETSLVLLDELGAGTDPQEGAALAMALVQEFLELGSTTLVATHYAELKAFAHGQQGLSNASVEFDVETLQPTYHLTIGLPGRSNALAIAQRLGLPESIVERARGQVTAEDLDATELLDDIRRQREAASEARREAERVRVQAQQQSEELAERLETIEDERRERLQAAREQAEAELDELQDEIRELRRRLSNAGQPLKAVEEVAREADQLEQEVSQPVVREPAEVPGRERSLSAGDRVLVRTLNSEGVIVELGETEAEVQVGALRVRAQIDELTPAEGDAAGVEKEAAPTARGTVTTPDQQAPPMELDLRGQRAEEALAELDQRLDAAFLAGLRTLRVIHGKGTGKLRQVVRDALSDNPYTASVRGGKPAEGGEGVTIVELDVA